MPEVFALVDALRHRPDAFVAAGKRTKQFWTIVTGVARPARLRLAVGSSPLNMLGIIAFVGAGIYLADVRPALRQVSGRGRGQRALRTVVSPAGAPSARTDQEKSVPERSDPRDEIFVRSGPGGSSSSSSPTSSVTVKIITVEPGHRLSLQTHDHRGEFWQVLDVPIEVTVGERTWSAAAGRDGLGARQRASTGWPTRATRPGRLLEIAFGDFDEADIVRLEDDYAR